MTNLDSYEFPQKSIGLSYLEPLSSSTIPSHLKVAWMLLSSCVIDAMCLKLSISLLLIPDEPGQTASPGLVFLSFKERRH